MTKTISKSLILGAVLGITTLGVPVGAVNAQATAAVAATSSKTISALKLSQIAASLVALRLSRESGVAVVADSALSSSPITLASLGGTLDTVLTQIAGVLPPGAVVRATLVPDNGTTPAGDDVAALLRAQDAFGPKPAAIIGAPGVQVTKSSAFVPGQFELLGKRVTLEQAAPQIASLHLRPVYLLTLQRPNADPVGKMGAMQAEAMRQWAGLTPDQRKQAMDVQFHAMMNMEPADRMAMLGTMMDQGAHMMQMMQEMPPDQKAQFQQEMMAAMKSSGLLGKIGGGAPPPGTP